MFCSPLSDPVAHLPIHLLNKILLLALLLLEEFFGGCNLRLALLPSLLFQLLALVDLSVNL